ncbi:unnamed protein product [Camellia sinensis]
MSLVLPPTLELAQQSVKVHTCVGGTSVREDQRILSSGVHVVVGTPGRVFDMLRRQSLRPVYIKMFVLDEADEMLSREAKKDEMEYKLQRIPFLEEQVRKVREGGKLLSMDIERLLLSEDNRFDFVNEVAAEAKQYVENNRDEYGGKKAILHVLSNRMNDAGFYRPEAYMEDDPYKPGPNYLREEL